MSDKQYQTDRKTLLVMKCLDARIYQRAILGFDRKQLLLWDFYKRAFSRFLAKIVILNPDMPVSTTSASENLYHLKKLIQSHRFSISTENSRLLIYDRELAAKMGTKAFEKAAEDFLKPAFRQTFPQSIETIGYKWNCKNNDLDVNEAMRA